MKNIEYNRTDAVNYAKKWALLRNPNYYNFQNLGGDCTNFVSQSIYAGAKVMNLSHNRGWYYYSASNRSASWTSVEYLYEFLVNNQTAGPYAKIVSEQNFCSVEDEECRYTGVFGVTRQERTENFAIQNHFVLTECKPYSNKN